MCVWVPRLHFSVHVFYFFFFFLPVFVDFGRQFLLLWTVYTLFTHCAYTVHVLKNIKNGSHDTIYTFKNYFVTVFSVFSNNKFNPNTPLIYLSRQHPSPPPPHFYLISYTYTHTQQKKKEFSIFNQNYVW